MRKLLKTLVILCIAVIATLVFFGCSGTPSGINNLKVDAGEEPIFDRGTSVITVTALQNVEKPTKFNPDVKKEDVVLSGYLSGKQVDSVTFVDEKTLSITISGETKTFNKEIEVGYVSLSKRVCTNEEDAYAVVDVYNLDLYRKMNLQAEDYLTVYDRGTQTLTVVASQTAEHPTKFKSDISVEDIVLDDYLEGKWVSAVIFVNDTTIKLNLTGNTEDFEGEWEAGMLTVKARACTINRDCYTYVKVYNTCLSVKIGDSEAGEAGSKYSVYYTKFTLNNGSFSSDFNPEEDVTLVPYDYVDDPLPLYNGEFVSRSIQGNQLIIRINSVDTSISRYPKVRIGAGLIEGSEAFEIEIGRDDYVNIIL